ncbi:hypothetical protein BS78_03G028100 [Paspalum vaginatum]|uniref:KIB1-4 beta-propeller domain-containing protein n=1 Tax=Paspalum vaginatum TaxID=158149 RepID=A0A9W7X8R8_9POAL|nr:hypothetical protein BS78_K021500 [Paspalum vaginatum]KAJ1282145.1 hypothetical protein BS78_03G028100 [Paspalum vaginatum]
MEQPDWLSLPLDLLELIAQRSRNAVTGLAAFRSVCRTWRAVVGPAPRLLLPRCRRADDDPDLADDPADYTLVFPLSSGWCIVADGRDTSCHLSHLATGRTAALPKLNATYDAVEHLGYVYRAAWKVSEPRLLCFMDGLRFAVHVPPGAAGMTILMHHMNRPGSMVFCRPGDGAWTNVEKRWRTTAPTDLVGDFLDFAYHDGKMFRLDIHCRTVVFDAATLDVVHRVPCPPLTATPNLSGNDYDYIHLVALPSKLVLIQTSSVSCRPVAFHIFELVSDAGGLAWVKVADAGNYELFLDSYHATFKENIGNGAHRGTRIYYVHDDHQGPDGLSLFCPRTAYCYSVHDNKLEGVYSRSPEDSRADEYYSTNKPSWFVP